MVVDSKVYAAGGLNRCQAPGFVHMNLAQEEE